MRVFKDRQRLRSTSFARHSYTLFVLLGLATFFVSCSRINHVADVVKERQDLSPTAKALNETRFQILENKNSLRIALLKIQLQENFKANQAIVLDTASLSFLKPDAKQSLESPDEAWGTLALARLHGQLLPEFYQVLALISQKNLPLYILCVDKFTCRLIRQNLSKALQKSITFLSTGNQDKLAEVEPMLVLASDNRLFVRLENSSPYWKNWNRNWVHLKEVDRGTLLRASDIARVVPTINEF